MPQKILLIGWDAADWSVAKPLVDAGKMPALKSLMDQGVWGNLATIQPILSPMLWTSIATGKRAWKHGVHGFSEPTPDNQGVQPITNLSRKTKAVWNIFNQQGWKSNIIGWWPSSPAEPINGVMVSNHFQQALANLDAPWPMRKGTVHPERLEEPLREFRLHPAELSNEHIMPFIPCAAEIDQAKDLRMESCAKIIAEITSIHAAATATMQLEPWDFMSVYYDGIDHFGHGFMRYHPPRLPWIAEDDFELYKDVIEAGYRYHDMMLATLLELAGDETTVMLVSDHGFESGNLRPKTLPNEPAGPAAEHSPFGLFCLKGKGIRKGERIYGASLLDIAPTLLHLKGLPVGADMDGKVLVNCFEAEQRVETIESWDIVDGDDGRHQKGSQLAAAEARESLKQLVDLGYIDEPNPDVGKAVDETIRELQYNLAQAYIGGGHLVEAAQILNKLWQRWPYLNRFGTKLLGCALSLGQAEEARAQFDLLIKRKAHSVKVADLELKSISEKVKADAEIARQKAEVAGKPYTEAPLPKALILRMKRLSSQARTNAHTLHYFEGSVLLLEEKYSEAIEALQLADSGQDTNRLKLYPKIAEAYVALEDWEIAKDYYTEMLSLTSDSPDARLGLARVHFEQGNYFHSAAEALASLELIYHNPKAHTLYARALIKLGKFKMAKRVLLTALSQNPNHSAAHLVLYKLYAGPLENPSAAQTHLEHAEASKQQVYARKKQPLIQSQSTDPIEAFPSIETQVNKLGLTDTPLIIVSGLPRSGTSLMMQILEAGGIEVVSDGKRAADDSNPKGYYEDQRVKQLSISKDTTWLHGNTGKGIKIVAPLVTFAPTNLPIKIIFMQRGVAEVLSSQRKMLLRDEKLGGMSDDASLSRIYGQHLSMFNDWASANERVEVLPVRYSDLINNPRTVSKQVATFLGKDMQIEAMQSVPQAKLYRERK